MAASVSSWCCSDDNAPGPIHGVFISDAYSHDAYGPRGAAHLQNLIVIVSYFCRNNYCPGFFLDSTLLDHTYCSNSATLIAADNPPHLQHSPYIRQ